MEVLFTILIIIAMLVLLVKDVYDPLKVFTLVVAIFLLMGAITLDEAVDGFSNKSVLAVGVLFIIAGSIEQSSYFQEFTKFSNLNKNNFKPSRLFLLITTISAFINNTPVVSIFIPITKRISDKTEISVSKLLIPVSYLTILGGTLTLIGTSTNLVVSGLMEDLGLAPMGFLELTKITFIPVILATVYIIGFYDRKLPDTSKQLEKSKQQTNEHVVRFVVKKKSSIIGKTVKEANLRALSGVYLVEIERRGNKIFPVTPDEIINSDDILAFAGQTSKIDELRLIDNLVPEPDAEIDSSYFKHDNTIMLEVVLTQFFGKPNLSIKELKFREKYNAVVIGIIRNGECINEKIGSIQPKLGDILLLIADKGSKSIIEEESAFTIINTESRTVVEHSKKSFFPIIAFIGTVLTSLIFGVDILYSAIIGVSFLLLTNTIQVKDALNMVDFKTVILIAMSFGIGKAITNTGTAEFIANLFTPIVTNASAFVVLAIVFAITTLVTTFITNNAAAVLVVPIVYEITQLTQYDARPFLLLTALAASCAFLSPYAYQTNTMVYGAGGYKFKDFVRFGTPVTLIVGISSVIATYLLYFR